MQEAEQAEAEGNACNEKCIRTQAGRTWTKVEAHWSSQGVLMLLTLVALFADDVRVLFVSKESDHMWSVMTIIVLVIFTVEWAGNSTFQRGYFMSMFFFLDLLATLSLLTDIHWIGDDFYGVSEGGIARVRLKAAHHLAERLAPPMTHKPLGALPAAGDELHVTAPPHDRSRLDDVPRRVVAVDGGGLDLLPLDAHPALGLTAARAVLEEVEELETADAAVLDGGDR